jgi:hypothetical protein
MSIFRRFADQSESRTASIGLFRASTNIVRDATYLAN